MEDLVSRLRRVANREEQVGAKSLCKEAADEIERLRAIIHDVALAIGYDESSLAADYSGRLGALRRR
jgi:hypothetical protein